MSQSMRRWCIDNGEREFDLTDGTYFDWKGLLQQMPRDKWLMLVLNGVVYVKFKLHANKVDPNYRKINAKEPSKHTIEIASVDEYGVMLHMYLHYLGNGCEECV